MSENVVRTDVGVLQGDVDVDGTLNVQNFNVLPLVQGPHICNGVHSLLTTTVTKNDGDTDAGLVLSAGDRLVTAWDGGDACAITLPTLNEAEAVLIRTSAAADGGKDMVISLASGQTLESGKLGLKNNDATYIFTNTLGLMSDGTVGAQAITVEATHNTLTINATASNNLTAAGAEISFLGLGNNKVVLAFKGVVTGSGTVNSTFETSAA